MNESAEEIYSLLIPLDNTRLLLPRICVSEVIGYHSPVPVEDCPHWFLGYVDWSGRAIPVVSFEALEGGPVAEQGARCKIAILQGISGKLAIPFFGFVTQGFPQLVRVSRDVLRLDQTVAFEAEDVKLCRLGMLNEQPVVPNLERIESMIRDALSKRAVSA